MHRPEGITWGPKLPGQKEQLLYVMGLTGASGSPPPVNDVVRMHLRCFHLGGACFAGTLKRLAQSKELLSAAIQLLQQADSSSLGCSGGPRWQCSGRPCGTFSNHLLDAGSLYHIEAVFLLCEHG